MPDWSPDEEIAQLIRQQIAARRDAWFSRYRDGRKQIAEEMAFKGTLRSGAFLTRIADAATAAMLSAARESRDDALATLSDVGQELTPEWVDWIRQEIEQSLDSAIDTSATTSTREVKAWASESVARTLRMLSG